MKQPSKETAMWFAVKTKTRCEKAVRGALERQGITNYLPTVNTPRLHGARRRIVEYPLIPGYIFVHILFKDYLRVLQTENVVDLIRFGADLIPIPQLEIDLLKRLCADIGYEVIVCRHAYCTGDTVQVIAGPLKGITGKLMTIQGRKNLLIELRNVGHSLQVVQMKSQHVRPVASGVGA